MANLRYCELDTLVMVNVWEKLKETQTDYEQII